MAVSTDEIKNTYPLPVYNYRVEINGETISFSEAGSGRGVGSALSQSSKKGFLPGVSKVWRNSPRKGDNFCRKAELQFNQSFCEDVHLSIL